MKSMQPKNPLSLLGALLAFLLAPPVAVNGADLAGGTTSPQTGTIMGRVNNVATSANLEGALVQLEGTGFSIRTEREGAYRLQVPAGNYTLLVSYTGLDAQSQAISVQAGATVVRDISLTSEIYKLSPFRVSGEREGNALAITLQRQADNVKNVVSSDAYGTLAGNPAELLMRLPGVIGESVGGDTRYLWIRGMSQDLSTVTLDGNRMSSATAGSGASRKYEFQQVGSDTVERFEVIKSPTPDMDGDSIGGAVNMISKSAFDRSPERRLSGTVGATWRALDGRDSPRKNFSFSYSEVFGGKLGVAVNYGYRMYLSAIDIASQAHQNTLNEPHFISSLMLQDFHSLRFGSGGGIKVDYKLSDSTRFYVNTTRQEQEERGHQSTFQTFSDGLLTRDANGNLVNANNPAISTGGILPEFSNQATEWRAVDASRSFLSARSHTRNGLGYHSQIGGVHRYDDLDIDYNGFLSKTRSRYPGSSVFQITARNTGMRVEQTSEPAFPRFIQTSGPSIYDIRSYQENLLTTTRSLGIDEYSGMAFNLKKQFKLVVPAYIKTGARFRRQTNTLEDTSTRYNYLGTTGNMATADLSPFVRKEMDESLTLNGRYPTMRSLPFPTWPYRSAGQAPGYTGYNIGTAFQEQPQLFKEDIVYAITQNLNRQQRFKEDISAAYFMGRVEIGKLGILGGVRVEKTEVEGEGAKNQITPAEKARRDAWVGPVTDDELRRRTIAQYTDRLTVTGEYKSVFPSVHFRYEAFQGLVARLSYATNIGRPAIGQMIPRTTVSYENQSVSTTNPLLKPQFANNFDLGVEYYFEPIGLLSAGVFLKEIKNFIFTLGGQRVGSGPDNGFDGEYEGFSLSTQANGGFAKVRGFELAYQQQFTFLPGWLGGFGAYANYTRMETEGNYGTTATRATADVAGFIPETGNIGISYIRNRTTIRLQFNHASKYLTSYTVALPTRSYLEARSTLNIKTVYNINRHFDVYLDVNNVFAEPDRYDVLWNDRPSLIHKMSPQFIFGINARL